MRFQLKKNPDFLIRNPDSLLKNVEFIIKCSTPGDKQLRFEEGWVGVGTYSRREATRLLLLLDGSEDVVNRGPEWEGGALSSVALRWAAQVQRRGARGKGAITAR